MRGNNLDLKTIVKIERRHAGDEYKKVTTVKYIFEGYEEFLTNAGYQHDENTLEKYKKQRIIFMQKFSKYCIICDKIDYKRKKRNIIMGEKWKSKEK